MMQEEGNRCNPVQFPLRGWVEEVKGTTWSLTLNACDVIKDDLTLGGPVGGEFKKRNHPELKQILLSR